MFKLTRKADTLTLTTVLTPPVLPPVTWLPLDLTDLAAWLEHHPVQPVSA